MKLIILLLISFPLMVTAQTKLLTEQTKLVTVPCPIDTIKGIVFYTSTSSTHATITEGYFISPCGGYQIGNFAGYEDVQTFIPAYFIRNDELINGKRQVNKYQRQKNNGYFTDLNFNKIPFEGVYGLLADKNKPI